MENNDLRAIIRKERGLPSSDLKSIQVLKINHDGGIPHLSIVDSNNNANPRKIWLINGDLFNAENMKCDY